MRRPTIMRVGRKKTPINTLSRNVIGSGIGLGVGSVLLDGGFGSQSSYSSPEDYKRTTGRDLYTNEVSRGKGLADKISDRLSKLNIDKPKKKNITMNF